MAAEYPYTFGTENATKGKVCPVERVNTTTKSAAGEEVEGNAAKVTGYRMGVSPVAQVACWSGRS